MNGLALMLWLEWRCMAVALQELVLDSGVVQMRLVVVTPLLGIVAASEWVANAAPARREERHG